MLQDFESLVGADFDLELLVESVVQLGSLDRDVQVQAPGLFLAVGTSLVEHLVVRSHQRHVVLSVHQSLILSHAHWQVVLLLVRLVHERVGGLHHPTLHLHHVALDLRHLPHHVGVLKLLQVGLILDLVQVV